MLLEPFVHGDSLLHRLDPRGKIVVAVVLSLVIAVADSLPVIAASLAGSILLVGLARLPWPELFRRLRVINTFVFFMWLIVPVTFGGPRMFVVGPFPVSTAGVLLTAKITMKANAIFLVFAALVATSPIIILGHAMQRLRLPTKFVHLLLFTYRYIHVIEQEYQRLLLAALTRGFKPKASMHTLRTYAYLVGMLLVRSFARSGRIYEAMLCRGFRGKLYSLHRFSLTRRDVFVFALLSLGIAALVYCEWLKNLL